MPAQRESMGKGKFVGMMIEGYGREEGGRREKENSINFSSEWGPKLSIRSPTGNFSREHPVMQIKKLNSRIFTTYPYI